MRIFFCMISVLAVVASMLTGCAVSSSTDNHGTQDDRIEEARLNASTDFEREILTDGVITRAEYDEINQGLVTCMSDAGHILTLVEQGDYHIYSIQYSDESEAALMRCQDAGGAVLAGLYVDMVTNPNNIDPDDLMLQCLKREGLLPEAFTVEEYRTGISRFSTDSDGNVSRVSEWTLPFSDDEPGLDACHINPSLGTVK